MDDRTTRARIRDAAIHRFGEVGFERSTVREIAAAADVSPGLVLHHFGSKAGLREACDEHVVASFGASRAEMVETGTTDPFATLAALREEEPHLRYLMRALRDGSPAAARLFDEVVRESEAMTALSVEAGILRPSEHPHDQAVLLVAWQFGALALAEHMARGFGVEPFSDEMTARVGRAALEVLSHGVFADTRYEDAWRRLDEAADATPADAAEGESE